MKEVMHTDGCVMCALGVGGMSNRAGTQLFISRLSSYTTIERLETLFSAFGSISEARLMRDPKTQRPKGFAFVTFQSPVDALNALKAMNARIVDGGLIFVEFAKTERHHGGGPSTPYG